MFERASTIAEPGVFVTERSGVCTVTLAVAVLLAAFGSVPVSLTDTELAIVDPFVAAAVTATTTVKVEDPPAANVAFAVHVIVPVPPTAGVAGQVQPAGIVIDWNVVFVGVVSVRVAPTAAVVPLLVTVCV